MAKVSAAYVRWYAEGFQLGAAGATSKRRLGRPRLRVMVKHWRRGIADGVFARAAFVGAYAAGQRPMVEDADE